MNESIIRSIENDIKKAEAEKTRLIRDLGNVDFRSQSKRQFAMNVIGQLDKLDAKIECMESMKRDLQRLYS